MRWQKVVWCAPALLYLACQGNDGAMGLPGQSSLVRTEDAAGKCPAGGVEVLTGADSNHNGMLEDAEVSSRELVCNGQGEKGDPGDKGEPGDQGAPGDKGDQGQSGLSSLIATEDEPAGEHCPAGGKAIHAGLDQNGNQLLDDDEITTTEYVCNGEPGKTITSLVAVQAEDPGANCPSGGQAIRTGVDDNADGLLQPAEVDSTSFVCNGAAGQDGLGALVRQEDELAGANCPYGGKQVLSGQDVDGDGYLDDSEVESSTFVCNGEAGQSGQPSLFRLVDEPAGPHCNSGGQRIETGLDTNGNGSLDASEVTNASYVCNGADGQDGADGHCGLVVVNDEPPGPNCETGGKLVQAGIDGDDNGLLDANEVSSSEYVCNGAQGADGNQGHNSLVAVTPEPDGPQCANGGNKIESGIDLDDDGALEPGEVQSTSYVCNQPGELVRATNAAWGGVCSRGGVKLDSGNDDNGNGLLDDDEVDHTQYVCNRYVVQIDGGEHHTCAVISDGSVRCWGENANGQLGDGTTTDRWAPVFVHGLAGAAYVSAGDQHTCAVLTDGSARCWGANGSGQVGDGTMDQRLMPTVISGLTGVSSISAGGRFTCSVHTDGSARCWGYNADGQLGDGTITRRLVPTSVAGLTEVAFITTGLQHACSLHTDGSTRCWGSNDYGQLGDGTTTDRRTPVPVAGLTTAASIGAGYRNTCASRTDGSVRCWGDDTYGESGGSSLQGVTQVAVGYYHGCALHTDGTASCWGVNGTGQIGDGSTVERPLPIAVRGVADASSIATGYWHSCSIHADGLVRCWGHNGSGAVGDGSTTSRLLPTLVAIGDLAP